jgi:hypothetical protein
MRTVAAPRIDDRLRLFIAEAAQSSTPAEVTRAVGNLAWRLGLARPSYQQVRVLVRASAPVAAQRPSRSRVKTALEVADKTLAVLYQYPGPGLENWYRRYKRGGGL